MKFFIAILVALILFTAYWLFSGHSQSDTFNAASSSSVSTAVFDNSSNNIDGNNSASNADRNDKISAEQARRDAARRSAGTQATDEAQISTAEAFKISNDLAVLYQELLTPSGPEDSYYRYRILAECAAVHQRGLDGQLKSCENTARNLARENAEKIPGYGESFTASEIINACFRFTERCTNLDFTVLTETRADILNAAVSQGSVLARSSNLFLLSKDDPQEGREWLASVLNEQASPDLLRNASTYLGSSFRLRDEPFHGVTDDASLELAQRALLLTACRLETGCPPSSHFMQSQCNLLPGCAPWQGYEEWLYQNYAANPEDLSRVLELAQDYQQFLINGKAEDLLFPRDP